MLNQKSPRVLLVVFSIAVLILSPIIILILPVGVVETIYFDRKNILLLVPRANFYLMAGTMTLIIAILLLLSWRRSVSTYIIAFLLLAGSGTAAHYSSLSYTAIQDGGLVLKKFHTVNDYPWSSIAEVVYEYDPNSSGSYIFKTTDGEAITIEENAQFGPAEQRKIYRAVTGQGITLIEREKNTE